MQLSLSTESTPIGDEAASSIQNVYYMIYGSMTLVVYCVFVIVVPSWSTGSHARQGLFVFDSRDFRSSIVLCMSLSWLFLPKYSIRSRTLVRWTSGYAGP